MPAIVHVVEFLDGCLGTDWKRPYHILLRIRIRFAALEDDCTSIFQQQREQRGREDVVLDGLVEEPAVGERSATVHQKKKAYRASSDGTRACKCAT